MNTQYRTVKEVAGTLGLAQITIRTWLGKNKISYVKLGRSVRIPQSEVDRIVADGTVSHKRLEGKWHTRNPKYCGLAILEVASRCFASPYFLAKKYQNKPT